MKITLDPDALTLGDMEDFEKATGESLLDAFGAIKAGDDGEVDVSGLSMTSMVSLVWILGRATNPDFTRDDARKIRPEALEFVDAEPADPTPGSG